MRCSTFFILISFLAFSQVQGQERLPLIGKIVTNNQAVENVHIINLNTSVGTISSDLGLFSIPVIVGDTLLISSLIHERLKIRISQDIMEEKEIVIQLTPKVEVLDEMQLTGLTGNLEYDLQQIPPDTIPKLGWVFSTQDLTKNLKSDELQNQSKVNAEDFVNPISGGGGGIGLPDKRLIREQRLKRILKSKKDFPNKLLKEFGISYFTVTLGIKKEEIPKFISFCEPMGIFEKYQEHKILEVIEILKTESENYHDVKD